MIGLRLVVELRSELTHHFHPRFSNIPLRTKHQAVMNLKRFHNTESSQIGDFNMSLRSPHITIISDDLSLNKAQPSGTSASPITNAAVAPNAWFLGLPLEIREQVYSYLLTHYTEDHDIAMKPSPAGDIIFRRNIFHSAILSTNGQVNEEALRVFYRQTVWHIRIPAANVLLLSPYWAFPSLESLQKHPFFKFIRHIMLDFGRPYMQRDGHMAANRTFASHGRVRGFDCTTDVLPRRSAVEQIVNALVHVPALKTVSIEWKDVIGWGEWEEKCLCLRPLEKLPVRCVVESVKLAFPPHMSIDFYRSCVSEQAHKTWQPRIVRRELSKRGLEKLGNYLTDIMGK